MAYTVRELITRAYYLSGIVSREFQTVGGSQLTDGLNMLNSLLSFKSTDDRLIPYFSEHNFNAVINQETYGIYNLISIETFTFQIPPVRYSMVEYTRDEYFGVGRTNNVSTLPSIYHMERQRGGANVYIYPLPNDTYPMQIWGKFGLVTLTKDNLDDDLTQTYDFYYIDYLRYALTEYICGENNISLQPEAASKLKEYESTLIDVSPLDLSAVKFSTLQKRTGYNWGDVNIGKGWRPM